ncbi:MAG: DUF3795 domain-containing protein [Ignavibacteriaceae bacterium]
MNTSISYCGLVCESCPIYLATRETNKSKKKKMIYDIIDMCATHYGVNYKYEDINECDGCKSTSGRLFFGCNDCRIRRCAIEKGVENCAYCEEYACNNLFEIFKTDPGAKTRLDLIRNSIL